MVDIGNIALFLALAGAIYSAAAFVVGKRRNQPALIDSARNAIVVVCGFLTISVIILLNALITHNFGVEYVASYTSRDLPLAYVMSALWAGNAGSLLFWAWILAIMAA
jgi:cytochrome c-type biogenesis protein CcmF